MRVLSGIQLSSSLPRRGPHALQRGPLPPVLQGLHRRRQWLWPGRIQARHRGCSPDTSTDAGAALCQAESPDDTGRPTAAGYIETRIAYFVSLATLSVMEGESKQTIESPIHGIAV